ncbi:transporter substrate-binding domain-containing protein, partial [Paraburkholderia sp. RL18-101-BIB-B]|uniref:transporter substrate-binding domain-containing protein n=1 Tax=Paraburkholderia sp. RL18-101-BIB-B TaxID=3031634 RepID=UPI0038BA3B4C
MNSPSKWLVALGCLTLPSTVMGPFPAVSGKLNPIHNAGTIRVDASVGDGTSALDGKIRRPRLTVPVDRGVTRVVAAASVADRPLRVVVAPIAPFVLPQTNTPAGFSIDLWDEVARRIRVDFTWTVVPTQAALLLAVQRRDADVAIAAITMTPEREKVVDFSLPFFDSGLQIMVRAQNESAFLATFWSIPWRSIGQLLGIAIGIVFLLANLVWLIERKHDRNFQKPYLRAIGEGLWVTTLIIATGEHGDRDSANVWKRVLVPAMWLIGAVLIAQLTATV